MAENERVFPGGVLGAVKSCNWHGNTVDQDVAESWRKSRPWICAVDWGLGAARKHYSCTLDRDARLGVSSSSTQVST